MEDKYGVKQDSYCYPNSSVLKNLLNIEDSNLLEEAEAEFILMRAQSYDPTFKSFNLDHLKKIHQHLFQDIYEWAGEIRTVDISKGDTRFCNLNRIEPEANKLLLHLENHNLATMNPSEITSSMAELYCDLNVIHPFREGNGRAQRLFFDELAGNSFYKFDWSVINQKEWLHSNIAGYYCDYRPMIDIFDRILHVH